MLEKCDFYVYVVFRPTGVPCYIGKGRGRRWQEHLTNSSNTHLRRIAHLADGKLPIVILRSNLMNEEALRTEIALIAAIGRMRKGGLLVNHTDGGDGANGYKHTKKRREKIRRALSGKPKSEVHRQRLSETRAKFRYTEEQREALSDGHIRQWSDPIKRVALSVKTKGRPKSDTTKAAMKLAWVTRSPFSEVALSNMQAGARRRAADPNDKERRSKAALKGWYG